MADAIRRSRVIPIRYLRWAQPHEVPRTVRPAALHRGASGRRGGPADRDARARLDRLEIVIPTESLDHAAAETLRLGTDVEVMAPPELRERLAATVRRLAARYAT